MPNSTDPIAFDGRVAIVTGGGGGLGSTYCLELARRGAKVVVTDLGGSTDGTGGGSTSSADKVVDAIKAAGGEAIANYDSVSTIEGGAAITQAALDAFGTVDIVINNAGTLRDKAFANLDPADIRAIIDVHLLGAFNVTQPAFRVMKEKGYGRILNTASSAGIFGNFGQTNYGAAKMGLVGFTNVLAVEGAKYNITANALAPVAKSRLTEDLLGPMVDKLSPDLVMPLALYLVSESCTLTHEIYSVAGGHYARIFVGLTTGWDAAKGSAPTLEDIHANLDSIRDEDGYIIPLQANDELRMLAKALA